MIEIKQPQIITEESADGRCGRFIVEPLEKGLGTTLGNSLRRMLLSALPGTAIVGIKIDGVQHEFSTIPAVAEDVVEMMLAGATAVQVGAENLVNPYACRDIINNLQQVMNKYRIEKLSDIIGEAHR